MEAQTITSLRDQLQSKQATAVEITEHAISTIQKEDQVIGAFLEVLEDDARAQAARIDEQQAAGETLGALAGIPVAIKANICTIEGHTSAASRILEHFSSPYEATVITKLKEAGAVIIGKTNLDEFAMGSSTEFSALKKTANPWDHTRVPGGSSGGSAAAVASGQVGAALGTDTGGSIRQPASLSGAVGLKPTYGRVSRFGAIAYGSSLDQIGPFTRTVRDSAEMLSVLAGVDSRDATSSPEAVADYIAACGKDIAGMRIGIPKEFFSERINPEVKKVIEDAISNLKELGAEIKEISLPLTDAGVAVYYLIAKAEASTNLGRYDGLRYGAIESEAADLIEQYMQTRGSGFGPEVKRAILMGTYALSAGYYDAWYKQATKVRKLIREEYIEAFQDVDVIAGPVSLETAFPFESKVKDPLMMYLADQLTVPMSVAGIPALSVPCGFAEGLPVGLQLAAPHFEEEKLFQVGHAYEQANEWWQRVPTAA